MHIFREDFQGKGKYMELNEMEKRMLYQTDGSERYAILHELLMASRYAKDPDRRKTADSLIEKLRPWDPVL